MVSILGDHDFYVGNTYYTFAKAPRYLQSLLFDIYRFSLKMERLDKSYLNFSHPPRDFIFFSHRPSLSLLLFVKPALVAH